ncbi:YlmC/YmxH family sporulation protein [Acididesulfobacillus acetoxydans]|uniref:YlmC/YmxH family sporulation protein n=1 Tax=Acididesulfobacillus acetoxydans TaxID=1561005 RepID=UPI001F0DD993|nr:YlmC/YmxH family sporulation protein [Acididesulfobacillus acetoxydans]
MLLSDLAGKEIINLHDGARLGLIGDADLAVSPGGSIEAIILTSKGGFAGFLGDRDRDILVIPWRSIKKVGTEVIIVDLHNTADSHNRSEKARKYSI